MLIHSIRNKALTFLAMLALGLAGGCHHSDAPLPPEVEDPGELPAPDKLTLCLNVSFDNTNPATRAGNEPDRYDDPSGNFEKIGTLRVIIVRQLSTDKSSGIVEANRLVLTNDQGHPMYDDLEFRVIANEQKRIYLVANEQYLTAPTGFESPAKFLDSFKAVKKNEEGVPTSLSSLNNWTVSVPGLTSSTTEIKGYSNGLFSPSNSIENPRRLPLTEFFDLEVNRAENDPDDTFYSHLFMTRAAAKAMFYLNTSDNFSGDNVRNTYIKAISLSGVGSTEYVFPRDAVYSPSKESLISVSSNDTPATPKEAYITDFITPEDNRELKYIIEGLNIEIKKPANGPLPITSAIYFPESILEPGQHYIVGVQLSNGMWFEAPLDAESLTHNILSIEKEDGEHDAISRNTFLPIELYFDEAMNLTVNVLPWNREDYYVDYTANVGITNEHCLAFAGTSGQTGDYLSLDKTAAQLVLNYGKVAQGSFTIDSPVGYNWDAYLITTGGTTDAIQFQIPNTNYKSDEETPDEPKTITTTHISGKIGEKAEFGIVATVAPGNQQNSAELIVMATLATGTQVIVDVLRDWNSDTGILTIIENPI